MDVTKEVMRSLSEPFYALHSVTFLSYLIARQAATNYSSDAFRHHLVRRELQAFLSFIVLLCIKCRKSISSEALWQDGLLFAKGILILLASILDQHLAVWYLIMFVVIFLLCKQPSFKSLGNVVHMTPLQLENQLLDGNISKCWLIEFHAVWSSRCIEASQVFTNLSIRYSTEDIFFGSIDLGHFPKAGEKYDISIGANMGQLPTYVLFQGGSEISRLPSINSDGNIIAERFSESSVARYFELDRRFIFHLGRNISKRISTILGQDYHCKA